MPRRTKPVPGQVVRSPVQPESGAKPPYGARAVLIRKLKLRYPELSEAQIARHVGCSRSNVHQVLNVFLHGHSERELREFQANKADIYDAMQMRSLSSITPDKLAKASYSQLVVGAAILEDKSRLVRGQPTSLHITALMDVAELIREMRDRGELAGRIAPQRCRWQLAV